MHPLNSKAFEYFWAEVGALARSSNAQAVKKEAAVRVLDFAREVPMVYCPAISTKKGTQASIRGAVSVAIAAVIYSTLRGIVAPVLVKIGLDISVDQEQAIIGAIALVIGSMANGAIAWFSNWKRHRANS